MQDPRSVDLLKQGDGSTLKRLFKSNYAKLYPIVYRLARDADAANEIIRSSFRRLWDDRGELDRFESISLRLVGYAYEATMEYRQVNGVTGIEFAVRNDEGAEVARRLAGLDEKECLLYLLHVVDGFSVRELSRAFTLEEDEVREAIGRALVNLSDILESDLPEDASDGAESSASSTSSALWP